MTAQPGRGDPVKDKNFQDTSPLVLIVDDDPAMRLLERASLEQAGFSVREAACGIEALIAFQERCPDAILLDVMMPDVDGFHVCREIRKSAAGELVPIIMVTGLDNADAIDHAFEVGATDFICKPINWGVLGHHVRYVLRASTAFKKLKESESALQVSEERYALAARGANDGLWDWNIAAGTIFFSVRWKKLIGYDEDEIHSSVNEWFSRVHPDDIKQLRHDISIHLDRATSHFQSEYRMLHKDGAYRWMLTRGVAVRNENGTIGRMAGSQTDITERRRKEEKLQHDAFHDSLTNLPNRVLLMDRLEHALKLYKRNPALVFAVLFLDLDRFKVINDSLGHAIGDQLLVAVSARLVESFRKSDTVAHIGETFARLGGDEFVVLLEGIKHSNHAVNVATRIQGELDAPFMIEGHEIFITASIGIALSSLNYERSEEILRDADTALYRAKELGKARYALFDPGMHISALKTMQIEMDMRRAIERHEFCLHYQPIVSLQDGKLQVVEALIRWLHPVHGMISPMDFIPIAEENGLIVQIGEWVIATACRQVKKWQDAGQHSLRVAVNVSARQLRQRHFPATVAALLKETGLEARSLEIEVTESMMMENPEEATIVLNQLSALGLRLSFDDFGTGYSSLAYLPRFPIDTIKIDRSFIKKINLDPDTLHVVMAIVALCQKMGKKVVAEGIETMDQLRLLEEMGCNNGQGYLFSKPLDEAAIVEMIKSGGSVNYAIK